MKTAVLLLFAVVVLGACSPSGGDRGSIDQSDDVTDQYRWDTIDDVEEDLGAADYQYNIDNGRVHAYEDENIGVVAFRGGYPIRIQFIVAPAPLPPPGPTEYDCDSQDQIPESECDALVAIYLANDGPEWTYRDVGLVWLGESSLRGPCSWEGVLCERARGGAWNVVGFVSTAINGFTLPDPAELRTVFPKIADSIPTSDAEAASPGP